MRIGEVAGQAGVSVRALRYYEEQGLLASERTHSGQRRYDESAVDRVRFIQLLYAAGLGSRAILEIIPCVHSGTITAEQFALLSDERGRISSQIEDLLEVRARLDVVIEAAATRTS